MEPIKEMIQEIEKGRHAPFCLFYGADDFRMEKALQRIRDTFLPESAKDFNIEIAYGGETNPSRLMERARSLPFLANRRLIIVRRTEEFKSSELEVFVHYLENPSESTCIIFLSHKPDFRQGFYRKMKEVGRVIEFAPLKENQVLPWIKQLSNEIGLRIDHQACVYLQQIAGHNLRDISTELEKLYVRNGKEVVHTDQVVELLAQSRMFTIFEFVDHLSLKDLPGSLLALSRFLQEEDKRGGPLRVIGMLNRQLRLIWRAKCMAQRGADVKEVAKSLGLMLFLATNLIKQSKYWTEAELKKGLSLLYHTDRLLKTGMRPAPVLEDLVISLCGSGGLG